MGRNALRESGRIIRYCEKKLQQRGRSATVTALDLGDLNTEAWSHCFVIAVAPVVGNSSLLL